MRNSCSSPLLRWCLLPVCAGFALTAVAQETSPDNGLHHLLGLDTLSDDDWTRHFRIGALVALNAHANFSMNGQSGVSGNNPAAGIFDDGYVREDSTGNAGGRTTYWGYNSSSQYNAANGSLTMHSASSFSGQSDANASDSFSAGFELAYGDSYWNWNGAKIGWEFGFGILPISIKENAPITVNVTESTYVFNAKDIAGGGLIGAPYQGTYDGGPNSPTLSTTYTNGASSTQNETLTGTRTLDATLYTFRLGPNVYWDLNDSLGLYVGGGPAVGFAMSTLSYNESISYGGSTALNSGRVDSTSIVYGGYVNATLVYHAPEKADLYIGVQYMPLSDVTVEGNNRRAKLDLGGEIYISAGVNWPF